MYTIIINFTSPKEISQLKMSAQSLGLDSQLRRKHILDQSGSLTPPSLWNPNQPSTPPNKPNDSLNFFVKIENHI